MQPSSSSKDLEKALSDTVSEVSIAAVLACGKKYGFDGESAVMELGLHKLSLDPKTPTRESLRESGLTPLLQFPLPVTPAPSTVVVEEAGVSTPPPVPIQLLLPFTSPPLPPTTPFIAPYSKSWGDRIAKVQALRAEQRERLAKDNVLNRHSYSFTVKGDERKCNKDTTIGHLPTSQASVMRQRDKDGTGALLNQLTSTIIGRTQRRMSISNMHTPLPHNSAKSKHPAAVANEQNPWLPTGRASLLSSNKVGNIISHSTHRKINRTGAKKLTIARKLLAADRRNNCSSGSPRPRSRSMSSPRSTERVPAQDENMSLGTLEVTNPNPLSQSVTTLTPTLDSPRINATQQLVITCTVVVNSSGIGGNKPQPPERHGVVTLNASCSLLVFLREICAQLHLKLHVSPSSLSRANRARTMKTGSSAKGDQVLHDVVIISQQNYSRREVRRSLGNHTLTDPPLLEAPSHILIYTTIEGGQGQGQGQKGAVRGASKTKSALI